MEFKDITLDIDSFEITLGRFLSKEGKENYLTLFGITIDLTIPYRSYIEKAGYYVGKQIDVNYNLIDITNLTNGALSVTDEQGNEVETIDNWIPPKELEYKLKKELMPIIIKKIEKLEGRYLNFYE